MKIGERQCSSGLGWMSVARTGYGGDKKRRDGARCVDQKKGSPYKRVRGVWYSVVMGMQRGLCGRRLGSCHVGRSAVQRARASGISGEEWKDHGGNRRRLDEGPILEKEECLMHIAGLIRFYYGATFAFAHPRFGCISLLRVEYGPSIWHIRYFHSQSKRLPRFPSEAIGPMWLQDLESCTITFVFLSSVYLHFTPPFFCATGYCSKAAITYRSTFHALEYPLHQRRFNLVSHVLMLSHLVSAFATVFECLDDSVPCGHY